MSDEIGSRTIQDFGEQWKAYQDNDGYYGSLELLKDVFGPLIDVAEFEGQRIADIGAGTGRFTNLLLSCGAKKVLAVEPSDAFEVLISNTTKEAARIDYYRVTGEDFQPDEPVDFAFSYGVLHHIPDPAPVVAAMYRALRPGGRIGVWLYGSEGNQAYLSIFKVLIGVTRRLPHPILAMFVWVLNWALLFYVRACHWFPLPLSAYMTRVFEPLTPAKRRLVIYDQLNPAYAKYYTRGEALSLIVEAGFEDVEFFHRHAYSWTVVGHKPRS